MKHRRHSASAFKLLLLSFAALASCANRVRPLPLHPYEAAVFRGPEGLLFPMRFDERDQVSLSVQRDLDELNHRCITILASVGRAGERVTALDDGRALLLQHHINSLFADENSCIYLWPDWRNADVCIPLDEFTNATPISPTVIRLNHYEFERSKFLDVRRPNMLFDRGLGFGDLKVAANDKWFGSHLGNLYYGELTEPDSLNKGARLPLDSNVHHFSNVCDGEVLLVRGTDGVLRIIRTDSMTLVHQLGNARLGSSRRDGAFIHTHGRYAWFTFRPDGSFTTTRFKHGDDETPMQFSRCGQWVVTRGRMWAPGIATWHWRPVPGARPTTPKPNSKELNRIGAWLSWQPTDQSRQAVLQELE